MLLRQLNQHNVVFTRGNFYSSNWMLSGAQTVLTCIKECLKICIDFWTFKHKKKKKKSSIIILESNSSLSSLYLYMRNSNHFCQKFSYCGLNYPALTAQLIYSLPSSKCLLHAVLPPSPCSFTMVLVGRTPLICYKILIRPISR